MKKIYYNLIQIVVIFMYFNFCVLYTKLTNTSYDNKMFLIIGIFVVLFAFSDKLIYRGKYVYNKKDLIILLSITIPLVIASILIYAIPF